MHEQNSLEMIILARYHRKILAILTLPPQNGKVLPPPPPLKVGPPLKSIFSMFQIILSKKTKIFGTKKEKKNESLTGQRKVY